MKWSWLNGLAMGAGLAYLFDPDRGRRRRALVRDKLDHLVHELGASAGVVSRDLVNRAQGVAHDTRVLFEHDRPDDDVLVERVRSQIGRLVRHPGSIEVASEEGVITLRGNCLPDEVGPLLARLGQVRGVREVENELDVAYGAHEPGRRTKKHPTSPAGAFLSSALTGLLALYVARKSRVLGFAASSVGSTLLARLLASTGQRG